MDHPSKVRDGIDALKAAISEARAAGYRVDGDNGLSGIGVSETAKHNAPPEPGDEYESMSKAALVELATARGVEHSGTKSDIIAALKAGPVRA